MTDAARRGQLAVSHGFVAVAEDGPVGYVETPLFPPDAEEPDYLVVRTASLRKPVVSTALVDHVDGARRLLYLRGSGTEITALPEHLPLADPVQRSPVPRHDHEHEHEHEHLRRLT